MSEPTIVFLLHANQWLNVIHPVTKLEFLDWGIRAGCTFFLENNAYVLAVKQSLWETLSDDLKAKFRLISRRVREELDGPFTDEARQSLEVTDPFDVFKTITPVDSDTASAMETIPEEDAMETIPEGRTAEQVEPAEST